jgi:hypothetical protein
VTWQVAIALGGGAVFGVAVLAFAWWAMGSLRDAQGKVVVAQQNLDVERRLRREAEKQRDDALATIVEQERTIATLRAIKKVTEEQDADDAAAAFKEEQDAIAGSADAAADAAVDLMRR